MTLRIVEHSGLTDTGRQRQTNEDRFLDAAPLFAVADGMGGARAGEVASQIALEAFANRSDAGTAPETQLAEIARAANRRIWELAQEDEARAGMGTTLTAVIVADREVAIGHVGDSRLYRFRDGELERLTTDHSLVEELVRRGELAPDEAESHPQKSIITRALGPEPDVEVETFTCAAREGDVYLLCSDGLTGMVSEEDVAAILRQSPSLEQGARALVDAANRAGGKDNITVVLFRLGAGDGEPGAETDTLSGSDTQVGVDTAEVRAAVAAAEAARTSTAEHPLAAGGEGPDDATLVVRPRGAEAAHATAAGAPPGSPPRTWPERGGGDGARAARGRRGARAAARWRRGAALGAAFALVAVAAVAVGLYVGGRQLYFVGASEHGLVTLYRGLPYDLPLGARLYSEEYESAVPARALPASRRRRVLDHQLRGRGDAVDLVRQLEARHTGMRR